MMGVVYKVPMKVSALKTCQKKNLPSSENINAKSPCQDQLSGNFPASSQSQIRSNRNHH